MPEEGAEEHRLVASKSPARQLAQDVAIAARMAVQEVGRAQYVETRESGEAWLGPLVPGRYTVTAQRDGRKVDRVFEVEGEEKQMEIEIVFE